MHPFKNWELNESLALLNGFTSDFTEIEIKDKEHLTIALDQDDNKQTLTNIETQNK